MCTLVHSSMKSSGKKKRKTAPSSSGNGKSLVAKVILVVVMLALFGLQVKDSVNKFLGRQMTLAMAREIKDSARMPLISFCPGFRNGSDHAFAEDQYDSLSDALGDDGAKEEKVQSDVCHRAD